MKVDMQNFQPLAMSNQQMKGMLKIDNGSGSELGSRVDKNNVATNIVNNKLNDALGIRHQPASNSSGEFDIEGVAKNIISFVSSTINTAKDNGATPDKLEKMLNDAKKGINEGLNEASKALEESGLLTEEISAGINQVDKLLSDGLEDFSDDLFEADKGVMTGLSGYREATHYSLSKDASYSITTKEGDEINITFNSNYLQQNASSISSSAQSSDYSSQKTTFQSAFSFEINGELNEDEQQAVNELMASLQNVSELFFSGDFDEAFASAKETAMDPSQLASFSMDLQRTETIVSIQEYQQVMPGKDLAEQLFPINNELKSIHEQAKPFAIEEHLTELLGWLIPDQEGSADLLEYSQVIFDRLERLDATQDSTMG